MPVINFTKMQGLGNDYIYITEPKNNQEKFSIWAQKLSDRHFGIGSDGLVIILPSKKADLAMRMFNPDGSESAMCGNAIRCVAKYAFEKKMVKKTEMTIDTRAGIKKISLKTRANKINSIMVDMGEPLLRTNEIPAIFPQEKIIAQPLMVNDRQFKITAVSLGNPHCVIQTEALTEELLLKYGSEIEHSPLFPQRTNVEFIEIINPRRIKMLVWERGTGITMACGTGACAALVAANLNGWTEREAVVELTGGNLKINWLENNHILMEGDAQLVFEGKIIID